LEEVIEKDKNGSCVIIKYEFKNLSITVSSPNRNEKQDRKTQITGTFQNNTAVPLIIMTELNNIPKIKALKEKVQRLHSGF
jgi:hypothetical protein